MECLRWYKCLDLARYLVRVSTIWPAPSYLQHQPVLSRRDSMSMMMAPSPVSNGTGLFIGAAAVVIIWFYSFSRGGYVSKDNFQ